MPRSEARVKELPGSKLFFHGEAYDAPVENQATMHLLAYQPPALGEPKTQVGQDACFFDHCALV